MTRLQKAMQDYTGRAQFHCASKLEEIIAAAREEERRLCYRVVESVDPSTLSGQEVLSLCLMSLLGRGSMSP